MNQGSHCLKKNMKTLRMCEKLLMLEIWGAVSRFRNIRMLWNYYYDSYYSVLSDNYCVSRHIAVRFEKICMTSIMSIWTEKTVIC